MLPLTGWYVHDVEQKIAAIGEVTLDSEEAIQAARTAYDALRQERKEQVSNYDVLVAAEGPAGGASGRGRGQRWRPSSTPSASL